MARLRTRARRTWAAALLLGALCLPAHAQDAPVALHCARGVPDYPDVELTLAADGTRVVDVTFVGFLPSRARADWSLRDCLDTAVKLDNSRDIVTRLWYRPPGLRTQRERLRPNGVEWTLVYRAGSKRIARRATEELAQTSAPASGL